MAVALTITITSNTEAANMADSVCTEFGYLTTINGSPNSQTKQEFVRQQIIQFIRDIHRRQLAKVAIQTANTTVDSTINGIVIT